MVGEDEPEEVGEKGVVEGPRIKGRRDGDSVVGEHVRGRS